jgi:hypothetical protein
MLSFSQFLTEEKLEFLPTLVREHPAFGREEIHRYLHPHGIVQVYHYPERHAEQVRDNEIPSLRIIVDPHEDMPFTMSDRGRIESLYRGAARAFGDVAKKRTLPGQKERFSAVLEPVVDLKKAHQEGRPGLIKLEKTARAEAFQKLGHPFPTRSHIPGFDGPEEDDEGMSHQHT